MKSTLNLIDKKIILAGWIIFSISCENKRTTEIVTRDTVGNKVTEYEVKVKETKPSEEVFENKFNSENEELKNRLSHLKSKIKEKGKKLNNESARVLERLDQERKSFELKNSSEEIEARWEKFKSKVNAETDSIERKM